MTKLLSKLKSRAKSSDDHWIPLSDLMSGLMMMFMLIAVMYIIEHKTITEIQRCEADILRRNVSAVKRLTEVYEKSQKELRDALELRLRSDLAKWGAELREDFTIRFNDPKTLFLTGQSTLTSRFREILSNFMPQYISILYDPKFRDVITEIRIE
jgi:chemotaxis protein MotB